MWNPASDAWRNAISHVSCKNVQLIESLECWLNFQALNSIVLMLEMIPWIVRVEQTIPITEIKTNKRV